MTGPRPYSNPTFRSRANENDSIDADFAGNRSFEAEEEARKRDLANHVDPKDSYEPPNPRGSGVESEYPVDDEDKNNNENIEGNRGAA